MSDLFSASFKGLFIKGMLASSLMLGGCSTLGDGALSNLNPFDRDNSREGQGDVAGEEDRISILDLSETLTVSGTLTPNDVVLPPAYINTDWPQVGGNSNHVVQHTGASGSLEKAWSKGIGKGSGRKGRVLAPPVIADGRIYVMDGDNRISAFDADSGAKFWSEKISVTLAPPTRSGRTGIVERVSDPLSFFDKGGSDKESVGGGLAIADGKVYASSGLGVMVAFDAATGAEIWRTPTRTPLHSAPAVSNGRAFAVSDDNELFAFDATNGEVLWTYQAIIEGARMLTVPSPAIVDDVVISPFASGELVALRVQNGGVLWQDALSSTGRLTPLSSLNDIASGPVISDGVVIATAQSGVLSAFDLRTGQRIWTQPAGSINLPLVVGDFVYTATTDGQIACISKLDGSVVWLQQLPIFKNEKKRKDRISWSGPILASDRLFLTSSRGGFVEVNPYNGVISREGKVGGDVFISPIIANETIYVLTDDAKLIALR